MRNKGKSTHSGKKGKLVGKVGTAGTDLVVGIDPGLAGAIVLLGPDSLETFKMPIDEGRVSFDGLVELFLSLPKTAPVFLERAKALAMGSTYAFNYGNDFAKVEIALKVAGLSTIYIDPTAWTKAMFTGVSKDLKPKARAKIALERLYPSIVPLVPRTPKSKELVEGVVDAVLIAGYGKRILSMS